jgi:hypothetical protein
LFVFNHLRLFLILGAVAIRNARVVKCDWRFVVRETCAKRVRKLALFDRLEKNMACGFSGIRAFLIAAEPIRIAHRAPPRIIFAGIRRGGSETRPLRPVIRM